MKQNDNADRDRDRDWIPVDGRSHGGEDPDPAERDMPRWAPNLDLPTGAK